jgi:MFS transporter, putative metabolite:H+ symporter
VTSFYIVFATAGGFVASLSSALLLGAIGWRGMAMLGLCVTFAGCLAWAFVPESVRWLAAKGRFAEARAEFQSSWGCRCNRLLTEESRILPHPAKLSPPR